jgi:uncharacterized protein (TIGR00266 family)
MEVQIKHQPSFSLSVVKLAPSETIKVEPGAMVSMTDGITVETKASGGLLGGIKRMVAGESFFQNTYTAPPNGGEMGLAATLPGDMRVLNVDESSPLFLRSGAYVASEENVQFDSSWGGAKGFFGSGGLVLLKVTGRGKVIAASYGAIEERVLGAGENFIIDTGHIVGFDGSIKFEIRKAGSWKSTFLGGEGLVCYLTGPGRVLLQTRSEDAFLGWLIPKLPTKSG